MFGSRVHLYTLTVLFIAAAVAHAGDPVVWYTPRVVYSSYYPHVPIYSYYWVAPSYYCPPVASAPSKAKIIPIDTNPDYAKPMPTPPTPSPELPGKRTQAMPSDKAPPVIIATRGMSDNYIPGATPLQRDLCRVGFWNVTGRDVMLTVEGKSWTLPKNQSVTLDLTRNFAWQVDQQPQKVERVPESQSTLELVIR